MKASVSHLSELQGLELGYRVPNLSSNERVKPWAKLWCTSKFVAFPRRPPIVGELRENRSKKAEADVYSVEVIDSTSSRAESAHIRYELRLRLGNRLSEEPP